MIGSIRGKVIEKQKNYLILDVLGVGYKIFSTEENIQKSILNEEKIFWTHLVVRENALDLYGFLAEEELSFFELLISISGIGPKVAISILSVSSPQNLKIAISSGDISSLTTVSGIGKKNAEKIVLELKDKIKKMDLSGEEVASEIEVFEALSVLGFERTEIRKTLEEIPKEIIGTNQKIKEALKILGR